MLGTSRKNFTMFNKLCGKEVAKNIVLVTTKWAQVDDSVGREREQELSEVYWKQMLDRGLKADRFKHSDRTTLLGTSLLPSSKKMNVIELNSITFKYRGSYSIFESVFPRPMLARPCVRN